MFDITDRIPYAWTAQDGEVKAPQYTIRSNAFDVAFGNMPFLVYADDDHPYERATAQWRKEQLDVERQVGEQSLQDSWWRRSQADFSGGAGITYYEPLLGEGSENRFIDSRNIEVFGDELKLAKKLVRKWTGGGSASTEVAGRSFTLLFREGTNWRRYTSLNDELVVIDGLPTSAEGITEAPDNAFYVGSDEGIYRVSGEAVSHRWQHTVTADVWKPWYAKGRIIAAHGRDLYELSEDGGDLSTQEPVFTHPDTSWRWDAAADSGSVIWVAGHSSYGADIHAVRLTEEGNLPVLSAASVGISLPTGEHARALFGYLDMLLICTNLGFRVAAISGDTAQLGPLIWDDEPAYDVAVYGDSAYVGCLGGVVRRVHFATQVGDLRYAYSSELTPTSETIPSGRVRGVAVMLDGRVATATEMSGLHVQQEDEIYESGWIKLGFARYGVPEPKWFDSVRFTGTCVTGSMEISGSVSHEDNYIPLSPMDGWDQAGEMDLNLPGGVPFHKLSLKVTLNRGDPTTGPEIDSYQIKARPAPTRRQTLISVPVQMFDVERDRYGNEVGGMGSRFAWSRLKDLHALDESGRAFIFKDFRTGESRLCQIEQVSFTGTSNPDGAHDAFGGFAQVTLRTLDSVSGT